MLTVIECNPDDLKKSEIFCDLCDKYTDIVILEYGHIDNPVVTKICRNCCLNALAMFGGI